MSLLNKIVNSSIAENKTNRRLSDMSYSAINGQRQEANVYQPEGVVMPGQMNREKPLPAITKEMIEDFHRQEEETISAPNLVNGIPMKYKGVSYELDLEPSVDTKVLVEDTSELVGDRVYVSNDIRKLNDQIKETDDNIKKIKNEMDEKGSNYSNISKLNNEVSKMEKLKKELKEKNKLYEYIEYTIKSNEDKKREIDKQNTITAQRNREKLQEYERDLQQINRNRLNLQQQPYESDAEYYQRLKEIQTERYDPVLYKQRAVNQNTTELKQKLGQLFDDTSFREQILKNMHEDDKFLLNKSFDRVSKQYLDDYGFNNKSLNPRMVVAELVKGLDEVTNEASRVLQSKIKRNFQGDIYRNNLYLARENERSRARAEEEELIREGIKREQDLMRRREERIAGRNRLKEVLSQGEEQLVKDKAAKKLQAIFRSRRPYKQYQDFVNVLQEQPEREREIEERQSRQNRAEERTNAARLLQNRLRQNQQRQIYAEQSRQNRAEQVVEQGIQERLAELNAREQQANAARLLQNRLRQNQQRQIYAEEQEKRQKAAAKLQERIRNRLLPKQYQDFVNVLQEQPEREREIKERQERKKLKAAKVLQAALSRSQQRPIYEEELMDYRDEQDFQRAKREEIINRVINTKNLRTQQTALRNLREILAREKETREEEGEEEGEEEDVTPMSAASTVPQQELRRRKARSDKGQRRGPYTRQPRGRTLDLREAGEASVAARTRSQTREGRGIKKLMKPKKRTISQEEKMKNRLRLVASQIEAGNTNPKLIIEVNDLYKKLYNIDNAYQYLNKKK
jgi:urease gamma subunit